MALSPVCPFLFQNLKITGHSKRLKLYVSLSNYHSFRITPILFSRFNFLTTKTHTLPFLVHFWTDFCVFYAFEECNIPSSCVSIATYTIVTEDTRQLGTTEVALADNCDSNLGKNGRASVTSSKRLCSSLVYIRYVHIHRVSFSSSSETYRRFSVIFG